MTSADLHLAEATRALHDSSPDRVPISGESTPITHSAAPAATSPPNHTRRIIHWCRAQPIAHTLITSLQQARHRLTAALVFALVLAALLGAGATRTALSGMPAPYANVFLVLLTLLGIQLFALLIWTVAFLSTFLSSFRRQAEAPSLASAPAFHSSSSVSRSHGLNGLAAWFFSVIHPLLRWMARHTAEPTAALAAWQTIRQQFTANNSGRWSLSALTHSFWLAFNAGALATLLLLLSTRHVTFVWETTLLSEPHYIQLTQYLGALPSRIGFPTPTPDVVADSRWQGPVIATPAPTATPTLTTSPHASSKSGPSGVWSRFILGSLIVYGIIPRAILLLLSVAFCRYHRLNRQLDLSLPFYQTLLTHLEPVARHLPAAATHGDTRSPHPDTNRNTRSPSNRGTGKNAPDRPSGNPAIVGIELPPDLLWPPPLTALSHNTPINWFNLGNVESGSDHRRVLEQLAKHPQSPSDLVIVTDLNTTPDRGIERSLRELHAATFCTPLLVLTGGHALRLRAPNSDAMRSRIDSWTHAAKNAGLDPERILELDLEHLTEITRQRLLGHVHFPTQNNPTDNSTRPATQAPSTPRDLPLHTRSGAGTSTDTLPIAFNHISTHLRLWLKTPDPTPPTIQQQAALQLDIARLHNAHPTHRPSKFFSNSISNPIFSSIPKSLTPWASNLANLSPGDLVRHLPDAVQRIQSLMPASLRSQAHWGIAGAIAGSVGCLAAAALVHPMALTALPSWSAWGAALGAGANIFRSSRSSTSQSQTPLGTTTETTTQNPATPDSPNIMDGIRAAALYAVLLELQGCSEQQITARLDFIFKDSPDNLEPYINPNNPKDTADAADAWLETLRSRFLTINTG